MTQPFTRVRGPAAAFPQPNVDTDVIMPKQFLKGIDRAGLAEGAFYDLRHRAPGEPNPDFPLNRPAWRDCRFLVVGPNFGCGSSREHAVWGLAQLGIRALVGTSFAGIFFDNCARNGVLAISAAAGDVELLLGLAGAPETNVLIVDLPAQAIICEATGQTVGFEIDARLKDALVTGLDAVGWALRQAPAIRSFEDARFRQEPWLRIGPTA
jgi:3-isopropylmalate/(R)-2-methylmalate dehydratase small subunit